MPVETEIQATHLPPLKAPRGTKITCKGWPQEAAMRMLMDNLDDEVRESPRDLVVYGGTGKAARNQQCLEVILTSLKSLENDETLLVQSGKPVGIFKTHDYAPRVLIANSNLVGHWSSWEKFNELERAGLMMYGQMTAGSWIYIGSQGIVQGTFETFAAAAMELRQRDPHGYEERSLDSIARHVEGMLRLQKMGSITFDYGNNIRTFAFQRGVKNAYDFPGFVPAYIRPLFCEGRGPFRWAALSGDPADIAVTDDLVLELFPQNRILDRWIKLARKRIKFQGLPARICWLGYGERAQFGLAMNDLVKKGKIKAPIVIGRDHLDCGSVASPYRETESMKDGSDAVAEWPHM